MRTTHQPLSPEEFEDALRFIATAIPKSMFDAIAQRSVEGRTKDTRRQIARGTAA